MSRDELADIGAVALHRFVRSIAGRDPWEGFASSIQKRCSFCGKEAMAGGAVATPLSGRYHNDGCVWLGAVEVLG